MDYLFLDFGNVLFYPTTGEWFITPLLDYYLKTNPELNKKDILDSVNNYQDILGRKCESLEEENKLFYDFYKSIFDRLKYNLPEEDINKIAWDITYGFDKYRMFNGVKEELEELYNRFNIVLLSDNWPCGQRFMDKYELSQYFQKIYLSSYYGITKANPEFFEISMNELGIDTGDITFVDDGLTPLDTAKSLGIKSYQMDRARRLTRSRYKIIHSLKEI